MRYFACLIATLLVAPAWGQLVASQGEDGVFVYKMLVTPAAEPQPRLAHRLVFAEPETTEGNAASFWYRSIMIFEQHLSNVEKAAAKKAGLQAAEVHRHWIDPKKVKLDDLPIELTKASRGLLERFDIDHAARRRTCTWDLGVRNLQGTDIDNFYLYEWQGMRELSLLLCLDARVAVAEGRLDDALELLRLNTELAIDAAQEPLFVCQLIGKAIANQGWGVLRELVCQSEAPSLYWAIVDLPPDFLNRRDAMRYELEIGSRLFTLLVDPATAERTDEQWDTLFDECLDKLGEMVGGQTKMNPPLASDTKATTIAQHLERLREIVSQNNRQHALAKLAHQRLLAEGWQADELDPMPISRVLAIDASIRYRSLAEGVEAAYQLPSNEGQDARRQADKYLSTADPLGDSPNRELLPIATISFPAYNAAMRGFMIHQRELAALRLVETLRLHAGVTGKLPTVLDEISCVPTPRNPATGEPFVYRLEGETAVIDLPKSDGITWVERYEVRLAP